MEVKTLLEKDCIMYGDYVLSPCKNAFNSNTSWWLSKRGYMCAMYCFTSRDEQDIQRHVAEIKQYIKLFKWTFLRDDEFYAIVSSIKCFGRIRKTGLANLKIYEVWAKNTDGNEVLWFTYSPKEDVLTILGETDHLNIWLSETTNVTADELVSFVEKFNELFELEGERDQLCLCDIVDPEDWQDIANMPDAAADPRWRKPKNRKED